MRQVNNSGHLSTTFELERRVRRIRRSKLGNDARVVAAVYVLVETDHVAMESESSVMSEEDIKNGNVIENDRGFAAAQSVACDLRIIGDDLWRLRSLGHRHRQQRDRRQQRRPAEMTVFRNYPNPVCTRVVNFVKRRMLAREVPRPRVTTRSDL